RMVDKAQIFSSAKGDHYRTRMTHTLIVCQIAKSISHQLKLNSSLAEAIAIGHDLGHTPFGHQGERTLHAILTGKEGFEVNFLSLKSDDPIEDESALFPMEDLSTTIKASA
ncbi:MAG: HD domain-containing protein, partial [Streptococcus sp.]